MCRIHCPTNAPGNKKLLDKVNQLLLSLVNNATGAAASITHTHTHREITNATVATTTFACHVSGIVIKMVRAFALALTFALTFALALGLQFGIRLGVGLDRSCYNNSQQLEAHFSVQTCKLHATARATAEQPHKTRIYHEAYCEYVHTM